MEKGQIEQRKNKEYKKDIIVASTNFICLILLILSIINIESVGMRIAQFLDKFKPAYDLGIAFGYVLAGIIAFGLLLSCIIGIIILILMFVLRKKQNIQKNLFKIYFSIIFWAQSSFIFWYLADLVHKQQFNILKSLNFIILILSFTWYIYIPVIIMLLIYLIIKSVNNIRM